MTAPQDKPVRVRRCEDCGERATKMTVDGVWLCDGDYQACCDAMPDEMFAAEVEAAVARRQVDYTDDLRAILAAALP